MTVKILALDSTAKIAAVALLSDGEILSELTVSGGRRSHSELLLPMVEAALAENAMRAEEIDLFACSVGPGSFTGVRIGVSVIKGLAFGRGKPCAAVSTLEALAQNLFPLDGLYCPVMDARRAQVYNALFRREGDTLLRLTPDRAIATEDLIRELKECYPGEPIRLSGDGYGVVLDPMQKAELPLLSTPPRLIGQSAASVGQCAARAALRGETVSDAELRPVYLRMPQAERERLERLAAKGR